MPSFSEFNQIYVIHLRANVQLKMQIFQQK